MRSGTRRVGRCCPSDSAISLTRKGGASWLLPGSSGALAFDTFLTIGTKTDDLFTTEDDVSTTPGLTFQSSSIISTSASWFHVPEGPGNGGIGAPDANGRVLFFRGSFVNDGVTEGMLGQVLLQFTSDGVVGLQAVVFFDYQLPDCPWDCDGSEDGNVNVADLLALLGQFDGNAPIKCTGGACDYNGDGCVDVTDLLKVLAHYNTDPVGGAGCPQ